MTLLLRYLAHSEIGLVRKNNQDSGYASPHLLVVADGMGGAAAGDLASAVAIDAIREVDAPTTADQMLPLLTAAIHQANDRIAELVRAGRSDVDIAPRKLANQLARVGLAAAHRARDQREHAEQDCPVNGWTCEQAFGQLAIWAWPWP